MEKLNRCRLGSDCDGDEPENEHAMMMMAMIMIVMTMIGIVMAMILAIVMKMIMMMVMTRTRTTLVNDVLVMFLLPAVVCGRSMSRSPGRGPVFDQWDGNLWTQDGHRIRSPTTRVRMDSWCVHCSLFFSEAPKLQPFAG